MKTIRIHTETNENVKSTKDSQKKKNMHKNCPSLPEFDNISNSTKMLDIFIPSITRSNQNGNTYICINNNYFYGSPKESKLRLETEETVRFTSSRFNSHRNNTTEKGNYASPSYKQNSKQKAYRVVHTEVEPLSHRLKKTFSPTITKSDTSKVKQEQVSIHNTSTSNLCIELKYHKID
jgi:hypothetical protein